MDILLKNFSIILFITLLFFSYWFIFYFGTQRGPKGINGAIGLRGNIGNLGIDGSIGPETSTNSYIYIPIYGKIGPQGPSGPIGQKGDIGLVGPRGPMGIRGQSGYAGSIGQQGTIGNIGLQGLPGDDAKWHLSIIDKYNCQVMDNCSLKGYIPVGINNNQFNCCKLINDDDLQEQKYQIIKKGGLVNDLDPLIY